MTISRAQPIGWTPHVSLLTAAQCNALDIAAASGIDGAAGGTYTPTNTIDLGQQGLRLPGSANIALVSRSITRTQPLRWCAFDPLEWHEDPDIGDPNGLVQDTVVGIIHAIADLRLPHGCRLTSVRMRINPAGGHPAGPPWPAPPTYTVNTVDADGVAVATSAAATDATGGVCPAYEAPHWIECAGLAIDIDRTQYRYVLYISGEAGAVAVAGCELTAIETTLQVSGYTEYT